MKSEQARKVSFASFKQNAMKRTVILVLIAVSIAGCSTYNTGELEGVQGRRAYAEPDPFGMVAIPMGSFVMGPSDQDVTWTQNSISRTVAVDAFWMDETEITNNEYRQFVKWVIDSIKRDAFIEAGVEGFYKVDDEGVELLDENDDYIIDWDQEINMSRDEDGAMADAIEESGIYYTGDQRLSDYFREINPAKLVYHYTWIDHVSAAKLSNRYNLDRDGENRLDRSDFVIADQVYVYPDTLVWVRDFTYSFNEPMTNMYFSSPSYDNYPVVGVSWKQANAFCVWRTNYLNKALFSSGQAIVQDYRLPIEAEWEYAARGGLRNSMYPWGGIYLRNKLGCFIANFKPLRGNYTDDGSMYPARVGFYGFPNEFLLYDMAGNVAEWTITAYDPSAYVFSHDLNPYYNYNASPDDPPVMKRKVVRGGSWKDVARYLQVSTRDYEYQDTAKSYIGFRCVRSYLGNQ